MLHAGLIPEFGTFPRPTTGEASNGHPEQQETKLETRQTSSDQFESECGRCAGMNWYTPGSQAGHPTLSLRRSTCTRACRPCTVPTQNSASPPYTKRASAGRRNAAGHECIGVGCLLPPPPRQLLQLYRCSSQHVSICL